MAARFARDAAGQGDMHTRYADPGQAALAGMNAFAEGRYDAAFMALTAARPHLQSIGGSHAQRDVFDRIAVDAGLRAGRYARTEALLQDRIAQRAGAIDTFAQTRLRELHNARRIPAQ
jgi:hypothetical protein